MKAIRTRYYGPTNTRPSHITASDSDGNQVSVSYDDAETDMHSLAAHKLMEKMGWKNEIISGGFGNDQYWVMIPRGSKIV